MADMLLRMLVWATLGLALVLLLRKPARKLFGAGPAFTLWLLPVVFALAPLLPDSVAPRAVFVLPALTVTPHVVFAAAAPAGIDWSRVLAVAWLVGVAIALARLVWCYVRLRAGARVGSASWLAVVGTAAPGFNLRRVRMHPAGPALLCALPHSLLLLPADFAQRFDTTATRELVLQHELTHARRGDAWWSLAMEIASALLWFHPLAWLARPRFRLDQELACDAAALRAAPKRTPGYARALLDSVAVHPIPALIPWLAEPQLKERIAMISRIPPGTLRRRTGLLAIAAVVAGGLFVAGGQAPVRAAPPATVVAPPSVDITSKVTHPPAYPVAAVKKGEHGRVVLDVVVNAKGDVAGVTVDEQRSTAPAALQSAAVAAAANWKFKPAIQDGHPVGGVVRIPVDFSLSGPKGAAGGSCPAGFTYKQGEGKSFSCIHAQPKASTAS